MFIKDEFMDYSGYEQLLSPRRMLSVTTLGVTLTHPLPATATKLDPVLSRLTQEYLRKALGLELRTTPGKALQTIQVPKSSDIKSIWLSPLVAPPWVGAAGKSAYYISRLLQGTTVDHQATS